MNDIGFYYYYWLLLARAVVVEDGRLLIAVQFLEVNKLLSSVKRRGCW